MAWGWSITFVVVVVVVFDIVPEPQTVLNVWWCCSIRLNPWKDAPYPPLLQHFWISSFRDFIWPTQPYPQYQIPNLYYLNMYKLTFRESEWVCVRACCSVSVCMWAEWLKEREKIRESLPEPCFKRFTVKTTPLCFSVVTFPKCFQENKQKKKKTNRKKNGKVKTISKTESSLFCCWKFQTLERKNQRHFYFLDQLNGFGL